MGNFCNKRELIPKYSTYHLLLPTALLLFLFAFFTKEENFILHLQDTYYVFSLSFLMLATGILLLVNWAIYRLSHKLLFSAVLMSTHIILCLLTAIAVASSIWWTDKMPRRSTDITSWSNFHSYSPTLVMPTLILFFFGVGLLLFVINLITGLIQRKIS